MHELGGLVATASKDCSVAISQLGGGMDLQLLASYPGVHKGVVKCVELRDSDTFASCGNDKYGRGDWMDSLDSG